MCAGIRSHLTHGAVFGDIGADLSDPSTIPAVMAAATEATGRLDILICNHAKSGDDGSILDMTAARLDGFWAVDTRSTLLLTTEFARSWAPNAAAAATASDAAGSTAPVPASSPRRPGETIAGAKPYSAPRGHVVWMTSGQQHGPMRGEVAYATSKAALAGVTATVAAELLELGIVLNTIDPGPVNTGYLDPETADRPPWRAGGGS